MNAVQTLEVTKGNICALLDDYFSNNKYPEPFVDEDYFNQNKGDSIFKESRTIIKALASKDELKIPEFMKASRTLNEALDHLTAEMGMNENQYTLQSYVRYSFNEYIDYLEDEQLDVKIIHVVSEVPNRLTFEHIKEDLAKCEKRFNEEDYSGAITSARSLVEGVCNEILANLTGEELKDKLDLPALFKRVRKQLNLNTDNKNLEAPLKQVISGLVNIVNGLAEIRNENGDAHHRRYDVNKHHALVVINSAKTVVTFLFNTYEYQLDKGTLTKL